MAITACCCASDDCNHVDRAAVRGERRGCGERANNYSKIKLARPVTPSARVLSSVPTCKDVTTRASARMAGAMDHGTGCNARQEGRVCGQACCTKYHDMEMPNLGLSKADVDNILAYLETTARGRCSAEAAPRPRPRCRVTLTSARSCSPAWCASRTAGRRAWLVTAPAASGPWAAGILGPDLTDVAKRIGGADRGQCLRRRPADADHESGMDSSSRRPPKSARTWSPSSLRRGWPYVRRKRYGNSRV